VCALPIGILSGCAKRPGLGVQYMRAVSLEQSG
jgi:hypothetical protein